MFQRNGDRKIKNNLRCNRFEFYLVTIHSVSILKIHEGNCFTSLGLYLDGYLALVNGMLTDVLRQMA